MTGPAAYVTQIQEITEFLSSMGRCLNLKPNDTDDGNVFSLNAFIDQ